MLWLPQRHVLVTRNVVLGVTTQVSTSSPITLTLPRRERDVQLVAIIGRHAGGVAAPALPSGWTDLNSSTTDPDFRICQKSCDGSEAPTTTSSATSATSMTAIVFALRISPPASIGQGGVATGSSASPNPGSQAFNPVGAKRRVMCIAYCIWNGNVSVIGYPDKYYRNPTTVVQGTAGGMAAILREADSYTEDAGAFTLSGSATWRAGIIVPDMD